MRALVCAAAAALAVALPAASATRSVAPALTDALRGEVAETAAPGAQAAVYRCGRLVWAGSAGVADFASRRPVTGDTRFVLASTTKTYVAAMVMQLVERGRISLDQRIVKWYPHLPDSARITVRELLTHTSGLADYEDGPAMSRYWDDPLHRWTRAEVLAGLGPRLFRPGSRFRYTNTNFIVLGGILERAGGRSVEAALQGGIARPLGLTRTSFTTPPNGSALFAHPFETQPNGGLADGWVAGHGLANDVVGPVWTDGGLATTASELARFGDALYAGRVVSAATVRKMTAFDQFGTGLGMYGSPFDGHRWVGHSGDYGGFESELWSDLKRGVTIAVVTNRDELDTADDSISDRIWSGIAGAYDDLAPAGGCS